MLERPDARRYRMLEVIGRGGFGKVYRARLDGPEGFVKDVAIKLLTDADAPESVLRRFRDESRILGLVRDRAVIGVDPPTRLEGRWAIVMEFADGASVAWLVRDHGPLPPRVALEIVAETARALDKLFHHPGPDGQPLHVLHRDLKPQNLQLTPGGQVKILDFGMARARFEQRESHTTAELGGTVGFIPPERLEGDEGPSGDVYALGVCLQVMLTGRRPSRKEREQTEEVDAPGVPGWSAAMDLARRMASNEPDDRPTARQVEERAAELAESLSRPDLRRWAEQHVPRTPTFDPDELVGNVLSETLAAIPTVDGRTQGSLEPAPAGPPRGSWLRTGLLVASLGSLVGLAVVGMIASLGVGYLAARRQQTTVVASAAAPAPEPPAPAPAPPDPSPPPDGVPVAPAPDPSPAPSPAPSPRPRPAVKKLPVLFSSVPMGAEVWVDGGRVGVTPLQGVGLTEGRHTVRMKLGADEITRTIQVDRRAPSRFVWKGGTSWSSEF